MAKTGVLPFVRGVDFSKNDFKDTKFPFYVSEMLGMRWLKLNRTDLEAIPYELSKLKKLEYLSLVGNNLRHIHEDVAALPNLRTLIARQNYVKNDGIPDGLLQLDDMTVLDLSRNQLKAIPAHLEKAVNLLVLNLSKNEIDSIPSNLFINVSGLTFLDLSHNKLDSLPPQMRRLISLQTLILNDNPLQHAQLRQLQGLSSLEVLHLRNTQRSLNNIPTGLDSLTNLADIDLSHNALPRVPECLYKIATLVRLNLSDNEISELSSLIDTWENLEYFNISRNRLTEFPASLTRVASLRKLLANGNKLDFNGIPSGIGKLHNLEVFSVANNNLETIPEGICRCGKLKKLVLNTNRLLTLPAAIHYLTETDLDVRENPDLVMPPKPKVANDAMQFYNIDFSLQHQLRLAGANIAANTVEETPKKRDAHARLKRLRHRRDEDKSSAKVLQGMQDVAKDKARGLTPTDEKEHEPIRGKRWDEALERPDLDYSEIYDEDVGLIPGILCWEIENFLPNPLPQELFGKFYEGDCYIILKTFIDESQSLSWRIWYWIGGKAPLDKKACSAIHAVNLRNLLGADSRTQREEMDDESDEFLDLFENGISYIEGGRTATGFYSVDDLDFEPRLFRVALHLHQDLSLIPVPLEVESLDMKFSFILDDKDVIYVWSGSKATLMLKSKARLVAEKINKHERKGAAEIINFMQGKEDEDFWDILGGKPKDEIESHISANWEPPFPIVYKVGLGMGYLEIPQVEIRHKVLTQDILKTKDVYIIDSHTDIFVWIGKKSTRLIRAAAEKLAHELLCMLERPEYSRVTRCLEEFEPQVLKVMFKGWNDIVPVDYTRTSESITKRGADMKVIMERDKIKTDLSALFARRQPPLTSEEAENLVLDWSEDLDGMECFVLEGKKFVRLPEEEIGEFRTEDCYVFLCRYWVPVDSDSADSPAPEKNSKTEASGGGEAGKGEEKDEDLPDEDIRCVVYFWQGRDANNMGWLTFTFSLQKKFERLFGDKLEIVRTHQQQENLKFLSHFKRKFIIHKGRRNQPVEESDSQPQLYYLRANGSSIATRCIEVDPDASVLNSQFCYILRVPFDSEAESGIVYVWLGNRADPEEARLAEETADDMFGETHTVQVTCEGEEPENFFWVGIGGKKKYDKHAEFMDYVRLFRCSNEKGYFAVSEKCCDFCQDDLSDDDVMLLDNGDQVFLWVGKNASDVVIKLSFKAAQVYIQHMKNQQKDRPRKLLLSLKHREQHNFTKCFHGWGKHREPRL